MRMNVELEIENIYLVRVGEYLGDALTPEGVKKMKETGSDLERGARYDCKQINLIATQSIEEWDYGWGVTIYYSPLPPAKRSAQIIAGSFRQNFFNNYGMKIEAKEELNRGTNGVDSIVDLINRQECPWPAIIVAHKEDLAAYLYRIGGKTELNPGDYRNF